MPGPREQQWEIVAGSFDWIVADHWEALQVGYEIHDGVLHMGGAFYNIQEAGGTHLSVGTLLLSGMPAELRPAAPVTVSVPLNVIQTDWQQAYLYTQVATPGVNPPDTVDIVVAPDGTVSLAALPPYANDPPDPAVYYNLAGADFPLGPLSYEIPVGGVSWRVAAPGSDRPGWRSLAPYLAGNFENIDAEYAIDRARLLLRGNVRAVDNGAGFEHPLLTELPPGTSDLVNNNFAFTTATVESGAAWTAAARIYGPFAGYFDGGVQYSANRIVIVDDTRYLSGNSENVDAGGQITPPDLVLPMDAGAAFPWTVPIGGEPAIFPVVRKGLAALLAGLMVGQDSTVAGVSTHGDLRSRQRTSETNSWSDSFSMPFPPPGSDHGPYMVSIGADLTALLASFYPTPDWVALAINAEGDVEGDPGSYGNLELIPAGWELRDDLLNVLDAHALCDPSAGATISGWVVPAAGGTYPHDPHNPYSGYLWRPADLPTDVALSMIGDLYPVFLFGSHANINLTVAVVPMWETRRNWVLAGDTINLNTAGWQLPYAIAPSTPSIVRAGSGRAGALQTTAPAGVRGTAPAELTIADSSHSSIATVVRSAGGSAGAIPGP